MAISGSTCWGHSTGVVEDNTRTFVDNWTGTGEASGSGDAEFLKLDETEYMVSEVVSTGTLHVLLYQNLYDEDGDDATLEYRHAASEEACESAEWTPYTAPFKSLGYVQVRVSNPNYMLWDSDYMTWDGERMVWT